jgi:hypothetical protein
VGCLRVQVMDLADVDRRARAGKVASDAENRKSGLFEVAAFCT